MGKPKVLKGVATVKIRCTIEDNTKDMRAIQNKANWSVEWIGPELVTGEVTAVELVKMSVSK